MSKWNTLRLSLTVVGAIAGAFLTWTIRPVAIGENPWLNVLLGAAVLGLLVHTVFSVFCPEPSRDRIIEDNVLPSNKSLKQTREK